MRHHLRWYGASPLHLLALLACFGLTGYAAARLVSSHPVAVAVWFGGAVIGHDLLLMPLYSLADRSAMAAVRHREPHLPAAPWINYVRVPAALSGLLLLVWFPLILRLQSPYHASTTLSADPYLWHWLAVTGTLFLLSAVAFALRLRGQSRTAAPQAARGGGGQQPAVQHDQEDQEAERAVGELPDRTTKPLMTSAEPHPARSGVLRKIRPHPARSAVRPTTSTKHGQATEPGKQSKPGAATNINRMIWSTLHRR